MATHSKIGASSASRWMPCPGSVRLIDRLAQGKEIAFESTSFAAEGTVAHTVAELCLKNNQDAIEYIDRVFTEKVNGKDEDFTVDEEMAEAVQEYLDIVRGYLEKLPHSELYIEQRFHLKHLHKDLFGTNDACILLPFGELHVFDYKHGKGVAVEAENNKQLMYYAIGAAYAMGFDFQKVVLHIVQPRAYHKLGSHRYWEIDADELEAWQDELKAAAEETEKENAPFEAGDWCRWCPAAAYSDDKKAYLCEAYHQKAISVAAETFNMKAPAVTKENGDKVYDLPKPEDLTPEQIAKVMDNADILKNWFRAVESFANAEAQLGRVPPTYKLVEGRKGNRKWADEKKAEELMKKELGEKAYITPPPKLVSPPQAEKEMGAKKFEAYVAKLKEEKKLELIDRAPGKLTLVKDGDVREKIDKLQLTFSPLIGKL